MVYDASKTGLNASLWVPSFPLPTNDSLVDLLTPSSWMSDIDLGEHFLNFPLHKDLQVHCGMDLRPYYWDETKGTKKTMWMRWSRCMMGLKPSPYFTIKATHLAYEVVWGLASDPSNAMQWSQVHLNLPGSLTYTPSQPWFQRLCTDGTMARSTPVYVDDLRPVGSSAEHCYQVAHQTASRLGYLGIQNASRKTPPPPANIRVPGRVSWCMWSPTASTLPPPRTNGTKVEHTSRNSSQPIQHPTALVMITRH
jgi:hypothetical protein